MEVKILAQIHKQTYIISEWKVRKIYIKILKQAPQYVIRHIMK